MALKATYLSIYIFPIKSTTNRQGLFNNRIKLRLRATYPCLLYGNYSTQKEPEFTEIISPDCISILNVLPSWLVAFTDTDCPQGFS